VSIRCGPKSDAVFGGKLTVGTTATAVRPKPRTSKLEQRYTSAGSPAIHGQSGSSRCARSHRLVDQKAVTSGVPRPSHRRSIGESLTLSNLQARQVRLFFYRAMLRRARYCYGKLSVRLTVRPPVTLRYRDHLGWISSKIISQLVSLKCSLSKHTQLQVEHPEILAKIGVGYGKGGFWR